MADRTTIRVQPLGDRAARPKPPKPKAPRPPAKAPAHLLRPREPRWRDRR